MCISTLHLAVKRARRAKILETKSLDSYEKLKIIINVCYLSD
jgi:hypothetical protein